MKLQGLILLFAWLLCTAAAQAAAPSDSSRTVLKCTPLRLLPYSSFQSPWKNIGAAQIGIEQGFGRRFSISQEGGYRFMYGARKDPRPMHEDQVQLTGFSSDTELRCYTNPSGNFYGFAGLDYQYWHSKIELAQYQYSFTPQGYTGTYSPFFVKENQSTVFLKLGFVVTGRHLRLEMAGGAGPRYLSRKTLGRLTPVPLKQGDYEFLEDARWFPYGAGLFDLKIGYAF